MTMDANGRWLPREGFIADVVGRVIKRTLFSPSLTLPLLLLAQHTRRGQTLRNEQPGVFRALKILVAIGLCRWLNGWLSRRALNNATSDRYNWNSEIAIVTGGSDGIGRRIALLLAARGLKVAVLDIKPLNYETPANVKFYPCDICSRDQIASAARRIRDEMGEPTILVNNAGVLKGKTILGGTDEDIRQTFEVNTLSHYWLAQEFLPCMISRNHGMVVTIASLAAYVTTPSMVDYSASKAAALAFHEGLATELRTRYNAPKVRTVVVNPGFARTYLVNVINPENTWFNPLLEPDSVAEAVVQQILTGSSGHIVMPGSTGALASNVRAFPHWLQNRVRDKCERLTRSPGEH
ncbi:hypothetical protein D8B26_002237 [Coccidioides posadasii str. Silveira]|uniref:Short-chain dehydrogenase/reductase 3 n=2 Tax=Coccidioides posadasii TaxID=199306 RepID=E9DDF6_COCPS|nr:short chain dehydrogenase/reductase [Coccidioides posadasii str. Silveira]QVM07539.1 hypothetical protein D8B26_002237 [Coccidioides posadasii str. Silveira]